jgi:four helix bundle protein
MFGNVAEWKMFSLRDQMQRAAISVPSNIAEGQERDSIKDFIRFLRIAKGSNGELRTQIYIAQRLNLIDSEKGKTYVKESKEISAMLQGLINALNRPDQKTAN